LNRPIREAILLGSYTNERYTEWSDIELVSETFEGNQFNGRNKIRKIILSISSDFTYKVLEEIFYNF